MVSNEGQECKPEGLGFKAKADSPNLPLFEPPGVEQLSSLAQSWLRKTDRQGEQKSESSPRGLWSSDTWKYLDTRQKRRLIRKLMDILFRGCKAPECFV